MTTLNMLPALNADLKGRPFQIDGNYVKINDTFYNLNELQQNSSYLMQQMAFSRDLEMINMEMLGNSYLG